MSDETRTPADVKSDNTTEPATSAPVTNPETPKGSEVKAAAPTPSGTKAEATVPAAVAAKAAAAPSSGFFRRFFWMDDRVREAQKLSYGPSNPGWEDYTLARQAQAGILQIGESGDTSSAVLLLQCSAARLLVRAHFSRKNEVPPSAAITNEELDILRSLTVIREGLDSLTGAQQSALLDILRAGGESALGTMAIKQRRVVAGALKSFVTALMEPLETDESKIGRVLFARWARILSAAALVVAVILVVASWISKQTAKPNLALNHKVSVSSQFSGAGRDTSQLVDGDRSNLGFHTECRANQHVTVDLGSVKDISSVVVYNRADCCQERAVPLTLQLSTDGQKYTPVKEQREQFDKWAIDSVNQKARYVRLLNASNNCFHLSELEVY
jgi:hypothetical protein